LHGERYDPDRITMKVEDGAVLQGGQVWGIK
jgi:hypothetical protein